MLGSAEKISNREKKNELRRYINNKVQGKSKLSPKSLAFIVFSKRMFSFHRSTSLF
jgi:hypothetical protein